jgi:hypothetical protein
MPQSGKRGDRIMSTIVAIIILIIIAVIWAIASTVKDNKANDILIKNLLGLGFITSEKVDVVNVNIPGNPFHFLIDKINKKWVLAAYRAPTAEIYDFSNLVDYVVIYRDKGSDIVKGKEYSVTASAHMADKRCSITESRQLNSENCEYLEIRVIYQEKAKTDLVCSNFILFEEQQSYAQKPDFVSSYSCMLNGRTFEKLLYEIACTNNQKK